MTFHAVSLILRESVQSFFRNKGFDMAAALSCYGFFSLIPLLFFVTYLLGNYVVSSNIALSAIDGLATHVFPPLSSAIRNEISFLTKQKTSWGFFSLVMLLVSIIPFMDQLQSTFSGIFKTDRNMSFLRSQLFNVLATLAALVLFALLVAGEVLYLLLSSGLDNPVVRMLMDVGASFAIMGILVFVFFRAFVPSTMTGRYVLLSSLIAAVLLLCFGTFFSRFLTWNKDYGVAFGTLKAFGIIIFWVYCSFLVILFTSEIMVSLSKRDALLLKKLFLIGAPVRARSKALLTRFVRTYREGDVIISEGEKTDSMFYILSGSVTINKKSRVIGRIGRGGYFGEMSMLLNSPTTATVIAEEAPLEVVAISRYNFDIILRENPEITMTILREMASRLKTTSDNVT